MKSSDSNYKDTLVWLFGLQMVGIKLGLENIGKLCFDLDDPQLKYPVVHIAGSNGKGSTAAFLASILTEAGYRTGLYTSPHLVDFSERIRIDGVRITENRVDEYASRLRPDIDRVRGTFFEATTAMAFRYFADEQVDIAVVETGLGGRLDATNIVQPVLTIITSLSIEHSEFLGDTIEDIAREKGGIVKQGVPLLTAVRNADALHILSGICERQGSELCVQARSTESCNIDEVDSMTFRLKDGGGEYVAGLAGEHQLSNARLAIEAARLLSLNFPCITDESVASGLSHVRENTGLRARMERLRRTPELVVDVAHNPDGVKALLRTWLTLRRPGQTHLVFGVLRSKDAAAIMELLAADNWKSLTLVQARSLEALPVEQLEAAAADLRFPVHAAVSVIDGVETAIDRAEESDSVLLFGSHYVVGEYFAEGQDESEINRKE